VNGANIAERFKYLREMLVPKFGKGAAWYSAVGPPKRYIYKLDDADLQLIRLHAAFIGGLEPDYYRHVGRGAPELEAYAALTAGIPPELHLGEPALPEGVPPFGVVAPNGKIVNLDINRYQEVVTNLHLTGVLRWLGSKPQRPVICEIGGGFGGLALQLAQRVPDCIYVLVDLPEILFLAGAYLATNALARSEIRLFDAGEPLAFDHSRGKKVTFVLVPHTDYERLPALDFDLAINTLSMQEMGQESVDGYVAFLKKRLEGVFYASNWSKHVANDALTRTIDETLAASFEVTPESSVYRSWRNRKKFQFGLAENVFLCARKDGRGRELAGMIRAARGQVVLPIRLRF
jgi:hypothetical protein